MRNTLTLIWGLWYLVQPVALVKLAITFLQDIR